LNSQDIGTLKPLRLAKRAFSSRVIAAVALFFVLDLFIRLQIHPDKFSLPERSFIWWAVQDYRHLKQMPNIVLFGSSLMLAAVNEGDAAYYGKLIDAAKHHRSYYLEKLLQSQWDRPASTFSFAIGGQMASDVYAIASNFITPSFKPKLIIWGIAPRDLLDSAFPGAYTSDTARYMNKIAGSDLIANEHLTFNSVVDQCLRHLSYIYRERLDFISDSKQALRNLEDRHVIPLFAELGANIPGRATMVRQLMNPRDGSMGDIEVGEWMISSSGKPSTELKDNTHEYQLRYNPFKVKTFNSQAGYFEKFLQQQQELGVKVVLVNMPLTKQNMKLLPPSSYDKYVSTVSRLATQYGASIIDLNHDPNFKTSDFFDTAHLNGFGSEKLFKVISKHKEIELPEYKLAAKETTPSL